MATLPHAQLMKELRPRMKPTKFVRWTVLDSAAHPTWDEAPARLVE